MSQRRSYETAYRFYNLLCWCTGRRYRKACVCSFYESNNDTTPVMRQEKRKGFFKCFFVCGKARNSKGLFMINVRNVPEMQSCLDTRDRSLLMYLLHPERGQQPEREESRHRQALRTQNTNPPFARWVAGRPRPQPVGAPLQVTVDNTKPKATSNQC